MEDFKYIRQIRIVVSGAVAIFPISIEQSWYFGMQMIWCHLIVHYVNAVGSLFVGDRVFYRLNEWRIAAKRSLGSPLGRS